MTSAVLTTCLQLLEQQSKFYRSLLDAGKFSSSESLRLDFILILDSAEVIAIASPFGLPVDSSSGSTTSMRVFS